MSDPASVTEWAREAMRLNKELAQAQARIRELEAELSQFKDMAKRRGGMLVATHARALEAERQDVCTSEERAVLDAMAKATIREGDHGAVLDMRDDRKVCSLELARRAAKGE